MKIYVRYLLLFAIVCLSGLVYLNTLDNEFVNFDDLELIVRNQYIKTLSLSNLAKIFTPGAIGAYQPVRTLSYAIDYAFWNLNPTGYHLTNILCNLLNTLLVYFLAYCLTKRFLLACLAALLFAVHPVHVEAVTWMSGRRDVLSLLFVLLALHCFLKYAPPSGRWEASLSPQPSRFPPAFWYGLSLICFTLGLLTKPSVVIFPLLLLLYDVCFLPPARRVWRRYGAYLPFFLVSFGGFLIFLWVSRASGIAKSGYHGGSGSATALMMLRVVGEYIGMLLMPRNLSVTYGVAPVESVWTLDFLIPFGVLAAAVVLTVFAWKRAKLAFFGMGWFFIALLPVANIIPISTVKADRYLYLPSVGFFLALAWCLVRGQEVLKQRDLSHVKTTLFLTAYWGIIALVLSSFTVLTITRNQDWKNSEMLWAATLETQPDSSIALNNLGLVYSERGEYEKAIALFELLIETHPIQEKLEQVYQNLATAYAGQEEFEQAINAYQKALDLNPEYQPAYLGLGKITAQLGQYQKAAEIYDYAAELDPQHEAVYTHLGNLAFMQEDYARAISAFQQALDLNPFNMNAYNGLGLSYARQGDFDRAFALYEEALQQNPHAAVIHNSLGTLYMQIGEHEKAIAEFTTSLELDPWNVEVRNNLGVLYLRTERYEDAAKEFIRSLEHEPENPRIITNLGIAYTHLGLYEEAIQMYQWALELDPTFARIYVLLGDLCAGTDQLDCALDAYQQALQFFPDDRMIFEKLQTVRKRQQQANPSTN
ncbi:tetratricopeptide repeat protein [candidate division KSB3 bacterium]|uniref:Tetratricopeptide repeat protein n=1 Tax=candidate division KSB3 bacterium TaxID=2044937 RepID=A0A9D5JYD4_9BACT|nr:tetratricopeptide repeat protein [candidate division KSB3 bacterium]MBD3326092.1 tetratricopeptide repeat protein [candidate division KSB3 bacterium]